MTDIPPKKDPNAGPEDEPGMPHFQRPDGRYIGYEPPEKLFDILSHMETGELLGLGLQPWDSEETVWLFPVEWYEHIPEGLDVYNGINEEWQEFSTDTHIKEARYGALPYGIKIDEEQ